jgi:glycosyltransferase involved in cell wall biosynthesis
VRREGRASRARGVILAERPGAGRRRATRSILPLARGPASSARPPMRIAVDLTSWSNRRGYGRFTRGLVGALLAHPQGHDFVLFVDDAAAAASLPDGARAVVVPTAGRLGHAVGAGDRRSLATLAALRRATAAARPDWLVYPTVYSYFPAPRGCRTVVGIHDVIPEAHPRLVFPDLRGRLYWRLKSWAARRRADYVLTVSDYSRDRLRHRFGIAAQRLWVVEEAADPVFRPLPPGELDRDLLERLGLAGGEPTVAYLGGLNPHKNLLALVDAVAELRRRPALAGVRLLFLSDLDDRFTPGREALFARLAERGLSAAATFPGFLADAQVVQALNAATLLALPSLEEGFGLPAVEAAACGTPVVATCRSPLPQLLAGGGLFVDPARPPELVAALAALLEDGALRARLGAAARERAARLTWPRAAEQFLGHLERAGR